MKKLVLLTVFMILLLIISACGYQQPEGYVKLEFYNNGSEWIAFVKEDGPIIDHYDYLGEKRYVYYQYDKINNLYKLAADEKIQVYILEGNQWYVRAGDIKHMKIGDKT
ncbi:MAG: hypothetical protein PHF54_03395 [Candidatus Pacebacteria bacterium]|nr:hypothetical protein [Candidatus Paceibacterota bacterium]